MFIRAMSRRSAAREAAAMTSAGTLPRARFWAGSGCSSSARLPHRPSSKHRRHLPPITNPKSSNGAPSSRRVLRKRNLDVASLQARGHNVFRRRSSPHLPRHLLFCVLAYRLQAERRGDLNVESRRLLDGGTTRGHRQARWQLGKRYPDRDHFSGPMPACLMTRLQISTSALRNAPTRSGVSGRLS